MEAINGVSCIKVTCPAFYETLLDTIVNAGEVHNIMTLLRLNSRWARLGRFSSEVLIQDESLFIRSFRELNEQLEGNFSLKAVDCVTYLVPFCQLIISEHASGPLTGAALSSLSKFVLYGFLAASFPGAKEGINLIARCIPRCVFEETDWESDEIILMKLLELSSLCVRSDASGMLTVAATWEIFETCMTIHNQSKASKLLKSEAATALRHLTMIAFSRADFERNNMDDSCNSQDDDRIPFSNWEKASTTFSISHPWGITLLLGKISLAFSATIDPAVESTQNVYFFLSLLNIALEAGGPSVGNMEVVVEVLRGDICRHLLRFSQSEDLAIFSLALRVVFNLFMSIKNHMKVQLEVFFSSVHLNILKSSSTSNTVAKGIQSAKEELALESLLEFCREPSLMHDIYSNYDCDVQCTNLFDSIVSTLCLRAIPSGALSMHTSCMHESGEVMKGEMTKDGVSKEKKSFVNILNRLSLEGVLSILHAVFLRCSQLQNATRRNGKASRDDKQPASRIAGACSGSQPYSSMENYSADDISCSEHSSQLEDVDAWCLRSEDDEDGETSVVKTAQYQHDRSNGIADNDISISSLHVARAETAAAKLRQRKLHKQRILVVSNKFNVKPLSPEWVRCASELKLLPPIPLGASSKSGGVGDGLVDAHSVAIFLKETPGLGKKQVGEFISRGPAEKYPYHAVVLKEYCKTFIFSPQTSFVEGFRQFLGHFHLPGEAQCIDRIMEAFAARIFSHLGENNPFANVDSAFVLSFSTIMLNTDLHNPGIPPEKKMTLDEFVRNNRGINAGKDLPLEFLEELYNEIRSNQIMVDASILGGDNLNVPYADTASWEKLLLQSQSNQAPASFTPTIAARRSVSGDLINADKLQHKYPYMGGVSNDSDINGYMTDDSTSKESESRDEAEYSMYMQLIFPPSAHEKDMFLVMATQVLDVVLEVWDKTEDDILLSKTLIGIWDYANICAALNMMDHFNKMVQLIATFVLDALSDAQRLLFLLSRDGGMKDDQSLNCVLEMDFNEFLSAGGKWKRSAPKDCQCDGNDTTENGLLDGMRSSGGSPTNGIYLYKGYMLLRLLFHICKEHNVFLNKDGWLAVISVLLWARAQRALPDEMLDLVDFKSKGGEVLPVSCFARDAKKKDSAHVDKMLKKLQKALINKDDRSSVWTLWGGLLWSSDNMKEMNNAVEMPTRSTKKDASCDNGAEYLQLLLQISLKSCDIPTILFSSTKNLSVSNLSSLLWALFVSVFTDEKYLEGFLSLEADVENLYKDNCVSANLCNDNLSEPVSYVGRHQQKIRKFFRGNGQQTVDTAENFSLGRMLLPEYSEAIEYDGVVVLEWISRIVFVNRRRYFSIWPQVHRFLKFALHREVDSLSNKHPYFIERAAVATISAAIHFSVQDMGINGSSKVEGAIDIWDSLRLLRDLPSKIVYVTADRVGAGLLAFIEGGITKEKSVIHSIEQWLLVFSLLSTATVGPLGRPYVWEAMCYLVDNNFVNNLNFTPCRNLVFRFLFRVFPSDDDDFCDLDIPSSSQQPESKGHNPWLTGGLFYQMRLTLMALGGYCLAASRAREEHAKALDKAEKAFQEKAKGFTSAPQTVRPVLCEREDTSNPLQEKHVKYMHFPLPVDDMSLAYNIALNSGSTFTSFSSEAHADSSKSHVSASSLLTSFESQQNEVKNSIEVACVEFTQVDDVEVLWLESVKSFADYANVHPIENSKNSIFCLKTVIFGAQIVELPRRSWLEALTEMLSRLPLHSEKTISNFETQQIKQLQQEQELASSMKKQEENAGSFSFFSLGTPSGSTRSHKITSLPTAKMAALVNEGYDISLHCSVIVFDTLVFHFKSLRSYEEFQPFWIKYISILAQNVVYSSSQSNIHNESIDMIGSLLRLLYQPETDTQIYSQLLKLSWTTVKKICPSMSALLEVNHPIIVRVLKEMELEGFNHEAINGSNKAASLRRPESHSKVPDVTKDSSAVTVTDETSHDVSIVPGESKSPNADFTKKNCQNDTGNRSSKRTSPEVKSLPKPIDSRSHVV